MGKYKKEKCKKNKYVAALWWPDDCERCNERENCELSERVFANYEAAAAPELYDLSEIEMLKDWDE